MNTNDIFEKLLEEVGVKRQYLYAQPRPQYNPYWKMSHYADWIKDDIKDTEKVYITTATTAANRDGYDVKHSFYDLMFDRILHVDSLTEIEMEVTKPFEVDREIADVDMDAFERIVCGG